MVYVPGLKLTTVPTPRSVIPLQYTPGFSVTLPLVIFTFVWAASQAQGHTTGGDMPENGSGDCGTPVSGVGLTVAPPAMLVPPVTLIVLAFTVHPAPTLNATPLFESTTIS